MPPRYGMKAKGAAWAGDSSMLVGVALAHIEDNPQQFPVVHRDKRRALLKRFPYGLYFRIESTSAVVVGCFHGHRNPTAWKSRQ